jgi:hypothetical protein
MCVESSTVDKRKGWRRVERRVIIIEEEGAPSQSLKLQMIAMHLATLSNLPSCCGKNSELRAVLPSKVSCFLPARDGIISGSIEKSISQGTTSSETDFVCNIGLKGHKYWKIVA